MADPNLLENILRAEGKYPRGDNKISPNAERLLTELGYPVPLAFQRQTKQLFCSTSWPRTLKLRKKLYEQIQSVLGDRTEPTPEDISKMSYLKGCMLESFRMQSTVEVCVRLLAEDTSLMGYHIPAETNVWYLIFIAAKNEQLFPNPEKFDPERWARDKPPPFAILPFGFGPRSCYGKRFAELELKLILLQMTRKFVLDTDLS